MAKYLEKSVYKKEKFILANDSKGFNPYTAFGGPAKRQRIVTELQGMRLFHTETREKEKGEDEEQEGGRDRHRVDRFEIFRIPVSPSRELLQALEECLVLPPKGFLTFQ